MNTTAHSRRGGDTQRQRLVAAIVQVTGEHGYETTTVARVIGRAGVSRPTFYEHFAGKDEGLLAASREIEERVIRDVRRSVARQPPEQAAAAAAAALVAFADGEPAAARVLMGETLAGGRALLDARDRAIEAIAGLIEAAYDRADPAISAPDLSPVALIGGVQRLLAARLRRGESEIGRLADELSSWMESYRTPLEQHRWRTLSPLPAAARSPFLPGAPLRAPAPLGPGRPRQGRQAVAEIHRQRILFATAEILQGDGYGGVSVAEITRRAGVDPRSFYTLFTGKQDVLTAVAELTFQHAMAVTAGAYFCAEDWPQRVWQAGRTLTQYLEQNPLLSRVSLLEGYAGGPETVQRLEDLLGAFTIFLQDGYQETPLAGEPSAVALEALASTAFEIGYRHARGRRRGLDGLSGLLGPLAHLCLAPFLGSAAANEHIERMSSASGSRTPAVYGQRSAGGTCGQPW